MSVVIAIIVAGLLLLVFYKAIRFIIGLGLLMFFTLLVLSTIIRLGIF